MTPFPTMNDLTMLFESLEEKNANLSLEDVKTLYKHLKNHSKVGDFLEIGFAAGVSAAILSSMTKTNFFYSIDPFYESFFNYEQSPEDFIAEKTGKFLILLREESAVALPALYLGGFKPSFIFIDGGHHFDTKFVDVYWANKLAENGTLVAIHDPWLPQTMHISSFIKRNYEHWIEVEKTPGILIYQITDNESEKEWYTHNIF